MAVALARSSGDEPGLANALNVLSLSSHDIAERLDLLRQSEQILERTGNLFGRMVVIGNLSLAFAELGLFRLACRQGALCAGMADYVTKPIRVDALVEALLGVHPHAEGPGP